MDAEVGTEDRGHARPPGMLASAQDTLRLQLEELGLSSNEARVLLVLLQLGSASGPELAKASAVPRTSVYPVLDSLRAKHLTEPLPGRSAVWVSPGPEEVLNRLYAAQEERLRSLAATAALAREALAELVPEGPPPSMPQVHLIHGAAQLKRTYDRLLDEARSEVLTLSRPPYSWTPGEINPHILSALARIERGRAIYEAAGFAAAVAEGFGPEHAAYVAAGLEARMLDHVPVKLVVFDRARALVGLVGPTLPEGAYPSHLLVDEPGYATIMALAFEHLWDQAQPCPQ